MPKHSPYGNLTATLLVVALFELVIDRLLARLFLSPGCHSGFWCLLLRTGPFLLHLAGALTLVVGVAAILGHLRRGELFPRGMRLTIGALSMIFMLLLGLSLLFGRIPDQYQIHLETSFGFVVALLAMSFMGTAGVAPRARVGFLLFALPPVLHIAALVSARGGWFARGPVSSERLTTTGEMILLLAALSAPLLLLPRGLPRSRIGAGLALAAGVAAFFLVAYIGRTDLVQTVALYSVQLELPRALSPLGIAYVLALFGFVMAVAVLLLSPGPGRLTGLGICLVGVAGYQTSSPVALGLTLCGLLSLATGTVRAAQRGGPQTLPVSVAAWRALVEAIAAALSDQRLVGASTPTGSGRRGSETGAARDAKLDGKLDGRLGAKIEIFGSGDSVSRADGEGSDTALITAVRGGRPVQLKLRRDTEAIREVVMTVGVVPPAETPPDATIESHEIWLGRRPEERVALPRMKTGDLAFDRKIGVHGRAPVGQPDLRKRLLKLADGSTITLWANRAARFVAPADRGLAVRPFALPLAQRTAPVLRDLVDTLTELIEAEQDTAPPDAAE